MGKRLAGDIPGLEFAHYFEAGASGATNTDQTLGYFVAPADIRVKGAKLVFEAALTGAATNYPKFSIVNLGTAGAGTVAAAALAFSSTAVLAGSEAPVAMTVDTDYDEVSKGEVMALKVAQQASGKVYPAFHGTMWYEFQ